MLNFSERNTKALVGFVPFKWLELKAIKALNKKTLGSCFKFTRYCDLIEARPGRGTS
ncbi:hypothetical protein FHS68_003938 [Dyadobacter arcticus]|uniref:Uncharacterized protein n=1 Tax=Dyadobacter arcticus TaxID=1078754 RepID=A0ABX0UP35_9BACT|nr:hypothetical protein [Dyadobacter arcticus]NIJ54751.1 hypothetical protein [Dyadobacter arcticus]